METELEKANRAGWEEAQSEARGEVDEKATFCPCCHEEHEPEDEKTDEDPCYRCDGDLVDEAYWERRQMGLTAL